MKLSTEELKAFESNPSNNFLTRGQMMEVVRELIAIRETQTVPVAFTGSGSLAAIKGGHEAYIWGNSAEAHPIELYTTPRPAHTEQDGWIKCRDKTPEEGGRYWCYVEEQNSLGKSHYQWNCSWNGDCWSDDALSGRVTHWMHLSAIPKPESE